MKRLFVVYNPRSSRYADVKSEVLSQLKNLQGFIIGKYEVAPTDVDDNAFQFSQLLQDGDFVLSAGGDATATIAANGILQSNKDATLAVLPFGNFNDLARTLKTRHLSEIFPGFSKNSPCKISENSLKAHTHNFYPLEISVDGEFFRYAMCYVTIGMTAAAVEIYDHPKVRRQLKNSAGRSIGSYLSLATWYFKNRHKKDFLPPFSLNGVATPLHTSDYAAVNGRSMARVMKGGEDYRKSKTFRSETDRLTHFWRLIILMIKSILVRIPGSDTTGDTLTFTHPATIELQAEGEYRIFHNVHQIEIKKGKKCLKVIEN